MTIARALLAVLWLVFALTAAAHATPSPAEPQCHMDLTNTHHDKTQKPSNAPMPCCSQPAITGLPTPLAPSVRCITRLHLTSDPARKLTGRSLAQEPHPPKIA